MVEIIPNWHPVFVHFSVALLLASAVLFVLSKFVTNWRLEDQWLAAAYWNLWLGTLISIGTVIAGFLAFNSVKHDDPAHVAMLEHRLWALVAAASIGVLAIWSVFQYRAQKRPHVLFVSAMLIGAALVGVAAWHGGELVFRHGLGVMSLPNLDDHSHSGGQGHDHGELENSEVGGSGHHEATGGIESDHHDHQTGVSGHDAPQGQGADASNTSDNVPVPASVPDAAAAPDPTTAPLGGESGPSVSSQ